MAFSLFGKKSPLLARKTSAPVSPSAENEPASSDFTLPGAIDAKHAIQVEEVARQMPAAIERAAVLYSANQADEARAVLEAALRAQDLGEYRRRAWGMLFDLHRIAGRHEAFEAMAVDYAVAFGISPPDWDAPAAVGALAPAAGCALEGEIVAAGADAFAMMRAQAEKDDEVVVDCRPLLRMDFVSAGQLLNVAGGLHAVGKRLRLRDANRLVAALWEAIGLDRVAAIEPRKD